VRRVRSLCVLLLLVAAGGLGGVVPTIAQVEPRADEILRAMGAYLASAEEFRFHAEISYDTFSAQGQELQYGGRADISARRPDRLHVEYDGDEGYVDGLYVGRGF